MSEANGYYNSYCEQTVTVKPSTRYRLTGWIKAAFEPPAKPKVGANGTAPRVPANTEPKKPEASLVFLRSIDEFHSLLVTSEVISESTGWKQVSVEWTTADDQTSLVAGCRVISNWETKGTVWFDDLVLEELPPQ
ncbi:MAG: hypothetical protein U0996_23045 [Planctomycetaceae bacterium]